VFQKILVANDGSQGGSKALAAAIELARRLGTDLHMVCVAELPRFATTIDEVIEEETEESRAFRHVVRDARKHATAAHVKLATHMIEGHAVPAIVEFIRHGGHDLLVIGYMGHSALYNRIIGSTTDRLVELAPCQVLVIK
jgi:nucleotide-binding universal stress UspA family protein